MFQRKYIFIILIFVFLVNYAFSDDKEPVFYASFLNSVHPEISQNGINIKWHGDAKLLPKIGLINEKSALYLGANGYGTLSTDVIDTREGTISFWMLPIGDPTGGSHTYLSWSWKGEKAGWPYGVLSQGWWEGSGGGGSTVFIFNNEVGGCGTETDLTPGLWTHYAFTWKINDKNDILILKLYQDGTILVERPTRKPLPQNAELTSQLYIGSDKASTLSRGRFADIRLNEFRIYKRALSEDEIKSLFMKYAPNNVIEKAKNPNLWMDDAINQSPRELRNKDERLLESRMLFAEGKVLYYLSHDELVPRLERIHQAGFNVYAPIVWHGNGREYEKGTVCASRRLREFNKQNPEYDGYDALIKEAHKRGMEVHSVFAIMQANFNKKKKAFPIWPEFVVKGTKFYNGYDAEFRKRIIKVVLEHVKNYQMDGLVLDFIRLQGGLDTDSARKEYRLRYGRDLDKDMDDENRIKTFSRDCLNDLVGEISREARKIRSNIVISVCDKVRPLDEGLAANGRNSTLWLKKGWIDVVYNMDYGQRLGIERMDKVRKKSCTPWAYVEGLGNYDWKGTKCFPRDPQLFAKLIDYCRKKYNDGNGVFVYFETYLSDAQIEALREGPFRELAVPHWKRSNLRMKDIMK